MADDNKSGSNGDGNSSNGNNNGDGGSSNAGTNSQRRSRRDRGGSRREGSFVDRFVRYRADGDPWAATEMLLRDNRGYRESFRVARRKGKVMVDNAMMQRELEDLDDENKQLREQLDGGIVLKGDDKKEYEAFKKLNVKAADVETRLKTAETLEREKKQRDNFKNVEKAAKKLGLDAELFDEFLQDKELELVSYESDSGKKVWGLKKSGDDKATPVKAEKFITKEFGEKRWRALEAVDDEADEFGDEDAGGKRGGVDVEDDDGESDDDDDVESDDDDEDEERPARRERSRSRERSGRDRSERRSGVRVPASRGRQGPQSRGARGITETVRKATGNYMTPSQRAKAASGDAKDT